MSDHVDPAREEGLPLPAETPSAEAGLRRLEIRLACMIRTTHPVRLAAALRHAEAEARTCWPAEQLDALLERVIRLALNDHDGPYDRAPLF
ncbi:hypothetical protein [Micromonospora sp. WMMA1976]|uniref:hypothetical protein n=1 Tax=Micromonospora sp. WMMA1976 TaxID=3014995 RepID=UPI00248C01F0|nr:hypothetical protein [Micromonospora sp. WMMA1976]WBC01118.1 hypothetical protein O7546_18300 [Micromonospora sp. WMMA1976]